MKRIGKTIMVLAVLSACAWQAKAAEANDTLVIENVDKVKIETRDTVQRIVITGSKDDPQLQYEQRIAIPSPSAVQRKMSNVRGFNSIVLSKKPGKKSKWESSLHFHLGFAALTSVPDGYSFKTWSSPEVGLGVSADYYPNGKRNSFSIGLEFNSRGYELKGEKYFLKTNGMLALTPYEAGQSETETQLNVFSLGVPIIYNHWFDEKENWGLSFGAILNFNTGAHASRQYEFEKEEYNVKTKAIGQRPVTVDLIAIISTPVLPIYVKYCPMTMFKDGRGPQMHQLSFGFGF